VSLHFAEFEALAGTTAAVWRSCVVHVGRARVWSLFDGVEKEKEALKGRMNK
jgi:hypothetical protein